MFASRLTAVAVTTLLLLKCSHAWAVESAFQDSLLFPPSEQSESEVSSSQKENEAGTFEDFSAEETQDLPLVPTIENTGDAFVSRVPSTSWSAGVDLTIFRAKYGSSDFSKGVDGEYVGTPRFYLGWESRSGFGIQGRLWGYDNEGIQSMYTTPISRGGLLTRYFSDEVVDLRAASLDLDFYKRFSAGPTDWKIGAGIRSAGIQYASYYFQSESTIAAGGVSLFSELRHVVYQTERGEIAFVANGRAGWLDGKKKVEGSSDSYEIDASMTTTEGALGLEWKRDLEWSVMTLRAQYESQLWDIGGPSDVAFNGGVVRAGFSW